jgi:hypothetical protein
VDEVLPIIYRAMAGQEMRAFALEPESPVNRGRHAAGVGTAHALQPST